MMISDMSASDTSCQCHLDTHPHQTPERQRELPVIYLLPVTKMLARANPFLAAFSSANLLWQFQCLSILLAMLSSLFTLVYLYLTGNHTICASCHHLVHNQQWSSSSVVGSWLNKLRPNLFFNNLEVYVATKIFVRSSFIIMKAKLSNETFQ